MEVILYSTGCPRCTVLEEKLDEKGVKYTKDSTLETMREKGIDEVPQLEIDGVLYGFKDAVKWVGKQE